MNKRAESGDQMTFFAFFFLLILIGGGIVAGVVLFFGGEFDFRESETKMLAHTLEKCIVEKNVGEDTIKSYPSVFFSLCQVNKKVLEDSNIGVKICRKGEVCKDARALLILGEGFESCFSPLAEKNKYYPKCFELGISSKSKPYTILVTSNHGARSVSA